MRRRQGGRRDQVLQLKIVIPQTLSASERELFGKLAVKSRFNARELIAEARR